MRFKLFCLSLFSTAVFANNQSIEKIEPKSFDHEILINSTYRGFYINNRDDVSSFVLRGGYNRTINQWLQLGLFPSIGYHSSGGYTSLGLLAGPTFNYSLTGRLQDAFFLSTAVGWEFAQIGTAQAHGIVHLRAELGKRFEVAKHISYSPMVGAYIGTGNSPTLGFVPLSFRINF